MIDDGIGTRPVEIAYVPLPARPDHQAEVTRAACFDLPLRPRRRHTADNDLEPLCYHQEGASVRFDRQVQALALEAVDPHVADCGT